MSMDGTYRSQSKDLLSGCPALCAVSPSLQPFPGTAYKRRPSEGHACMLPIWAL